MKILTKLINSFDNDNDGFSARKLTAFFLVSCIGWIHFKFLTTDNALDFLIVDLIGAGFFLGLITAAQIITLKNGTNNQDKPEGAGPNQAV